MAANDRRPFSLVAHPYRSPGVRGACAYEIGNTSSKNAIIFIGGLMDGPHTVPYIRSVSDRLEQEMGLSFSVFEIRMRSSFDGFGHQTLEDDAQDIAALVRHLRGIGREKVVLFGHSTGCQDCMVYTRMYAEHPENSVDGFILQGPVSDREWLTANVPDSQRYLDYANKMMANGEGENCVPKDKTLPGLGEVMTANRLHSLLAKGGDDDYFSSDLDDETVKKLWSHFTKPTLVLHSENDEFVPSSVDQAALNKKWQQVSSHVSDLSDLIPTAGHTVLEGQARSWLAERVVVFLRTCGGPK